MVLTAPGAPGALAFGGASGRQVGADWQARSANRHALGSPYTGAPKAARRRKGKPDSWGTRPIDLFWN